MSQRLKKGTDSFNNKCYNKIIEYNNDLELNIENYWLSLFESRKSLVRS